MPLPRYSSSPNNSAAVIDRRVIAEQAVMSFWRVRKVPRPKPRRSREIVCRLIPDFRESHNGLISFARSHESIGVSYVLFRDITSRE